MLTKVKEWIILNRDEKLEKYMSIFSSIFLVMALISTFFEQYVLAMLILLFKYMVELTYEAIVKQKNDIIRNNKLSYIVLSDYSIVITYVLMFVVLFGLLVVYELGKGNVIIIPIFIILVIKVPKTADSISKYFLKKLK